MNKLAKKMVTRRCVREKAVQALYLAACDPSFQAEDAVRVALLIDDRDSQLADSLATDTYLHQLVSGVLAHLEPIDTHIKNHLKNWSFQRVTRVDLSILRLAVFEMTYLSYQTPAKVALNEAIELAKSFSDDKAAQFINGVLSNLLAT